MTGLAFILLSFAAFRGARLVVEDSLFDRQRTWLYERYERRKWAELLVCPYCVGVWLAAFLLYAWFHPYIADVAIGRWLVWLLAVSGVQALASSIDARLGR